MNRLHALLPVPLASGSLLLAALVTVPGCSSGDDDALSTLPPIRTTTSTTTTTTPFDDRIRIYTVKEGENLSMIARSFEVPLATLIEYNADKLPDPNNVQPGTTLEIPPVLLVQELPTTVATTTEDEEP